MRLRCLTKHSAFCSKLFHSNNKETIIGLHYRPFVPRNCVYFMKPFCKRAIICPLWIYIPENNRDWFFFLHTYYGGMWSRHIPPPGRKVSVRFSPSVLPLGLHTTCSHIICDEHLIRITTSGLIGIYNQRFTRVSVNVVVNRQHSGFETPVATVGTVWESTAATADLGNRWCEWAYVVRNDLVMKQISTLR